MNLYVYRELRKLKASPEVISFVKKHFYPKETEIKKKKKIRQIKRLVSDYFGMPYNVVTGTFEIDKKTRKEEYVVARQFSMLFSYRYSEASQSLIAGEIGEKDHSTVVHACKKITNLLGSRDKKTMKQYDDLNEIMLKVFGRPKYNIY